MIVLTEGYAIAAAEAAGGKVIFPTFASGEMKVFTDFSDLANKTVLGKDVLSRQLIKAVIEENPTEKQALNRAEKQKEVEKIPQKSVIFHKESRDDGFLIDLSHEIY